MEPSAVKKIVIIGPESTGKSTLTEQLAAHFNTLACPEYAREYLVAHGTAYTFDDLIAIAKGQLALEDKMTEEVNSQWSIVNSENCQTPTANSQPIAGHHSPLTTHPSPLLFIDTDMYVMKVWCEYVFGRCHQFILDEIVTRKYHLYLFCNIDLPWVKDDLREYPDELPRQELYRMYKDLLINQQTPWVDISGTYEERLQKAIGAVEKLNNYIF